MWLRTLETQTNNKVLPSPVKRVTVHNTTMTRVSNKDTAASVGLSNKEAADFTGFTKRQVLYLAEKGIVPSDLDAIGRGSTRRYSRKGLLQLMVAKALRDGGVDFPAVGLVARAVASFYVELTQLRGESTGRKLNALRLHVVDGRFVLIVSKKGSPATPVLEIAEDGSLAHTRRRAGDVLSDAAVNIAVDLERVLNRLPKE